MRRTSRKDRLGIFAKEQAVLLIISTVFLILAAIVLVNLERPPVFASKSTGDGTGVVPPAALSPARLEPAPAPDSPAPAAAAPSPVTVEADITALESKSLLIPLPNVTADKLRDSFYDGRSEGRTHQALDIMAAGGTPVLAVADGAVMKLWQSAKGGITIYQSDTTGQYVYYYAHLMRYADGLIDGKPVKRGEVIGYVGDTGNAGPGNYHLHFAIYKPTAPGKWSGGIPINPYTVFTGR